MLENGLYGMWKERSDFALHYGIYHFRKLKHVYEFVTEIMSINRRNVSDPITINQFLAIFYFILLSNTISLAFGIREITHSSQTFKNINVKTITDQFVKIFHKLKNSCKNINCNFITKKKKMFIMRIKARKMASF